MTAEKLYQEAVYEFKQEKLRDPDKFKNMSADDFALYVYLIQIKYANRYSIGLSKIRALDSALINTLLKDLTNKIMEGKGMLIAMRHGEQDPLVDEEINKASPALKKVLMMRKYHNENDPITLSSAIESLGTVLLIDFLKVKMDELQKLISSIKFSVMTSHNLRAKQIATAVSETTGIPFVDTQGTLDCVNYLDEKALSNEAILKVIPSGTMPWKKEIFDQVVDKSTRSFEKIDLQMMDVIARVTSTTIQFAFTHSQQIQSLVKAMCVLRNVAFQEDSLRLENYGFVILERMMGEYQYKIYQQGVYSKTLLSESPTALLSKVKGNQVQGHAQTSTQNTLTMQYNRTVEHTASLEASMTTTNVTSGAANPNPQLAKDTEERMKTEGAKL